MKIAFLTKTLYPDYVGGGAISSRLIVDGLREQGIDVDVFTLMGDERRLEEVDRSRFDLPSGDLYHIPRPFGDIVSVYRHLPDMSEYDAIHVYGGEPLPGAVLRSGDTPVVATMNTLMWACIDQERHLREPDTRMSGVMDAVRESWSAGYSRYKVLPQALLFSLGKRFAHGADRYTVQTEGMRDVVSACGYDDPSVVPNLLDPRFDIDAGKDSLTIIFVGRLIERKGALDVVKAFADIPEEERERWSLEIYGDGPLREQIEEYAAANNIDEAVSIGYCDYDDLPEVYRDAEIMVHASKYPEPFSRTWLEALASDTAIVCSRNPSSAAVLEGIAELYDPFDREDLAASLRFVMQEDARRQEMVDAGDDAIERYRAQAVVEQYIDLYGAVR